jgi:hypothetical protein
MLLNTTVQELIAIDRDYFNSLEAYINTVESPCTVDSTSSNLRLLPWLDIGIVSTLPRFPHIVLRVASTPRVVYLSGYHTLFDSFQVLPRIPTYDIRPPRGGCRTTGPTAWGTHELLVSIGFILVGVLIGLLAV